MKNAPGNHGFDFTRDDAHAEAAAHKQLNRAGGFGAEKLFERFDVAGAAAEHVRHGGIFAQDVAFGIERDDAGRNVFENGLHQLAAAFEFLNGLLQVARELIDLRARIAELRGHRVERADQDAELVLRLFGNLIIEISGRDFARAFRERLNRHDHLFREKCGDPHQRKEKQHREEAEDQEHLALESAKILLFLVVFVAMRLDVGEAREEIRAREVANGDRANWLAFVERRNASDEIVLAPRFPNFDAGWKRLHRLAHNADAFADLRGAIFGLIVANHSTANHVAVFVENPERIEAGFKSVLQNFFRGFAGIGLDLAREIAQARERAAAEIVHQGLRLLGGDFERAREPAAERAIEQRIADDKHEEDREERERHGADDHLRFEAGAELIFAAFGPEAKDGAREDEAEDEKRGGDEAGDGVQPHDGAPVAGFERNVERAEGEDSGEEKRDGNAADDERPALARAEAHAGTEVESEEVEETDAERTFAED